MDYDNVRWEEPEPTKYELLKAMCKAVRIPFTYRQSWGWLPETTEPADREACRNVYDEIIRNYLEGLPEAHGAILTDYLKERQQLVERNASPYGAWYLFTLWEARSMFAERRFKVFEGESFLGDHLPEWEKLWFAQRFLEVWNSDGKRRFSLEEVEELTMFRTSDFETTSPERDKQNSRESKRITNILFRSGNLPPTIPDDPNPPPKYFYDEEGRFYIDSIAEDRERYHALLQGGVVIDFGRAPELLNELQRMREEAMLFEPSKPAQTMNKIRWEGMQIELVGIMDCLKQSGYVTATDSEIVSHFDYESRAKDRVGTYVGSRQKLSKGGSHFNKEKLKRLIEALERYVR